MSSNERSNQPRLGILRIVCGKAHRAHRITLCSKRGGDGTESGGESKVLGIRESDSPWVDKDISSYNKDEHDKASHELHMGHRVLVHAVEGYRLRCVEYPDLTGEGALTRATGTESRIA
jgi:hypothetical protein